MLHEVIKITKSKGRAGRGVAAGQGKTAGRGTKGQKSRKSRGMPRFFEGGQTKLFARVPKIKGDSNRIKNRIKVAVQSEDINKSFKDGEKVTIESLLAKKLISGRFAPSAPVKIIGKTQVRTGIDTSDCHVSGGQNNQETITKQISSNKNPN